MTSNDDKKNTQNKRFSVATSCWTSYIKLTFSNLELNEITKPKESYCNAVIHYVCLTGILWITL